ncbi:MAG: hypothetical protein A3B68_00050 [Candidatus Melainabacteria bacterium RIFCSPHIGHO2_02_FULL_34_12]|nr:MAG: hypothetical protein A3B68_00050 [Candidatus Melainabacteria bacterium RIFCSPHIGHO2_02_FULL_34_12]
MSTAPVTGATGAPTVPPPSIPFSSPSQGQDPIIKETLSELKKLTELTTTPAVSFDKAQRTEALQKLNTDGNSTLLDKLAADAERGAATRTGNFKAAATARAKLAKDIGTAEKYAVQNTRSWYTLWLIRTGSPMSIDDSISYVGSDLATVIKELANISTEEATLRDLKELIDLLRKASPKFALSQTTVLQEAEKIIATNTAPVATAPAKAAA